MSPRTIRLKIIEQSKRANVGHIGCALSVVEILVSLYRDTLKISSPKDPDRDRFILSKGHAALALYCILAEQGTISLDQLNSFCADGSLFGVHPEHIVPGIDFSSGSLGFGLSYGCGAALAANLTNSSRRAFVLLSDAECNEGSTWEAAMFAGQHKLANLCGVIDLNGQQALGYTKDIINHENLEERWRSFGWKVHIVDGHDVSALSQIFSSVNSLGGQPTIVLAKTTFGEGVSFMKNEIKWHYLPLNEKQYEQAVGELKVQ